MGIQIDHPVFNLPGLDENARRLKAPMTAIVDRQSKPAKFALEFDDEALRQADIEVGDQRLRLVGAFDLGTDFVNEGNLIMSAATFAKLFPHRTPGGEPLGVVDLGIVAIEAEAEAQQVRDDLATRLGSGVHVYTREGFRTKEKKFWRSTTPIGAVFSAGKIIGFVVGVVICYQVIFSGIAEHMPEFATLKAMGYRRGYFIHLIIVEAFWLALFGFVPGAIVSTALYHWLAGQTGLLMQMTPATLAIVFGFTVTMCVASGMLAVRKLLTADPASLF